MMSHVIRTLVPAPKPCTYTYHNHMKNFSSKVEYTEQNRNLILIKTTTKWIDEFGKLKCKKTIEQYKVKCQNK